MKDVEDTTRPLLMRIMVGGDAGACHLGERRKVSGATADALWALNGRELPAACRPRLMPRRLRPRREVVFVKFFLQPVFLLSAHYVYNLTTARVRPPSFEVLAENI